MVSSIYLHRDILSEASLNCQYRRVRFVKPYSCLMHLFVDQPILFNSIQCSAFCPDLLGLLVLNQGTSISHLHVTYIIYSSFVIFTKSTKANVPYEVYVLV